MIEFGITVGGIVAIIVIVKLIKRLRRKK